MKHQLDFMMSGSSQRSGVELFEPTGGREPSRIPILSPLEARQHWNCRLTLMVSRIYVV